MELLEKVGAQVPSLAVLVLVVKMFLQAQERMRESNNVERKEMFDRLNMLHGEHLSARTETRAVIADVAKAMREVSLALKLRE